MRPRRPSPSSRGSVLVAVVFATVILTSAVILVLDWSLNTLRDAKRKQFRESVTLHANNEMEYLFYQWSDKVDEPSVQPLATVLANTQVNSQPVIVQAEADLVGDTQSPFMTTAPANLTVRRNLTDLSISALGTYLDPANNLRKKAAVAYYRARVRATMTDPVLGTYEARVGRRFAFLRATPFTRAVFYEANMEFGAGSTLTINGDLQANNSIYIGSQSGYSTTVAGDIFYVNKYNGSTSPTAGIRHTYNGPSTNDAAADTWNDPIYDPIPGDGVTPNQSTQRAEQVKKLNEKETFVSTNVTPERIYETYANSSPPPYESVNDVYRSIIAPPPTSNGVAVAEDPTVAANRMYNKAGIRIAVEVNGSVTITDKAGNTIAAMSDAISSVRSEIMDQREQKAVQITTLDVGQLETILRNNETAAANYNGVVYIYDKKALTDSTKGYAVRLANASNVPNLNEHGFVVASDNPVYIQGSFNTVKEDSDSELPRCAIMGDAITVLSQGWLDANSTGDLDNSTTVTTTNPETGEEVTTTIGARRASDSVIVNSAIVSGNAATVSSVLKSGGVQNLVRYLENWWDDGLSTTVNGSLGQMFSSKYFTTPMSRTFGTTDPATGITYAVGIYKQPRYRYLNFDRRLAERPPAGTPSSRLSFYRGDLFSW